MGDRHGHRSARARGGLVTSGTWVLTDAAVSRLGGETPQSLCPYTHRDLPGRLSRDGQAGEERLFRDTITRNKPYRRTSSADAVHRTRETPWRAAMGARMAARQTTTLSARLA